jgi:hypothetical protein
VEELGGAVDLLSLTVIGSGVLGEAWGSWSWERRGGLGTAGGVRGLASFGVGVLSELV